MKNLTRVLIVFFLSLPIFSSAKAETPKNAAIEQATFAGGCFWCVVKPFHKYPGVKSVVSGYTGGTIKNPTYEQVSTGKTGHYEAVNIEFDPQTASYQELLEGFWRVIDPTDGDGQFADRGSQYKPAIFYHSAQQKRLAEESKRNLELSPRFKGKKIKVSISPAKEFYPAEEHHQDFYKKNPAYYQRYYEGSGRKAFIDKTWGIKIEQENRPEKKD